MLYLTKAKAVEWFPGCEWWDRVFIADECIDTLTCTVNTDCTQLPPEARERAEKEHHRFTALSKQEKEKELFQLAKLKQVCKACYFLLYKEPYLIFYLWLNLSTWY